MFLTPLVIRRCCSYVAQAAVAGRMETERRAERQGGVLALAQLAAPR